MSTGTVVVIVAGIFVLAGIAIWAYLRQRSQKLKERFGPEYGRTLREIGSRRRAEEVLEKREKRVDRLQIRPLRAGDQARFTERWRRVQSRFVDDPKRALTEADALVGELMQERGYPMADFDQRAADISVDHPIVVQNYRAAHDILLRHRRGEASTEDLRQAMVHYRILVEELLSALEVVPMEVRR